MAVVTFLIVLVATATAMSPAAKAWETQ